MQRGSKMIEELESAYESTLHMLTDGIEKMPDDVWRKGADQYLIPVRIAYHTIIGLEWLATELPPEEHKHTRRYDLNWMGSVDEMPSREEMLQDIQWIRGRIDRWFEKWAQAEAGSQGGEERLGKALYFLRHSQHHK